MISPAQIRNGRAMLGWRPGRLAKAIGLSLAEIESIEDGTAPLGRSVSNKIQRLLEAASIEFIPELRGGAGVRLRKGV